MARDDSRKQALAAIKAARTEGGTALSLGGIEWEPETIPEEILQLDRLESLTIQALKLTDLSLLARLPQLRKLTINSVREVDLSPTGQLHGLKQLEVTGDGVTSVEFLQGLTKLESLHIQGPVTDWGPLSSLTSLRQLDLQSDDQTDISPLSSLVQLQRLSLTDGDVQDLTPLSSLGRLEELEFYWGYVADLGPLAGLKQLRRLKLYATYEVTDLGPLLNLKSLRQLELSDCDGLTDEEVNRVRTALPGCRIE